MSQWRWDNKRYLRRRDNGCSWVPQLRRKSLPWLQIGNDGVGDFMRLVVIVEEAEKWYGLCSILDDSCYIGSSVWRDVWLCPQGRHLSLDEVGI